MEKAERPPRKFLEESSLEESDGGAGIIMAQMGRCGEAYLTGVDNILGIGQHQKLKLRIWINSKWPHQKKNQAKKTGWGKMLALAVHCLRYLRRTHTVSTKEFGCVGLELKLKSCLQVKVCGTIRNQMVKFS